MEDSGGLPSSVVDSISLTTGAGLHLNRYRRMLLPLLVVGKTLGIPVALCRTVYRVSAVCSRYVFNALAQFSARVGKVHGTGRDIYT